MAMLTLLKEYDLISFNLHCDPIGHLGSVSEVALVGRTDTQGTTVAKAHNHTAGVALLPRAVHELQ